MPPHVVYIDDANVGDGSAEEEEGREGGGRGGDWYGVQVLLPPPPPLGRGGKHWEKQ